MTSALRILCVDDDPDIRTIALMALALDPAIEARGVASAAEGLALLVIDAWRPDAILLDVMIGAMSGPEMLGRMRQNAALANIPVIFLTARAGTAAMEEYRLLGVTGVIVKPFDPIHLASKVRALLGRAA
jgi:two-component system, OmpR family, response regulator